MRGETLLAETDLIKAGPYREEGRLFAAPARSDSASSWESALGDLQQEAGPEVLQRLAALLAGAIAD